ncbi:pyridoxal phosphate-dependent transferase [Chytriomyces cf. hyalinus JEL632]|nr:pyridoxal phosphate-dependent transferase [Chytriomyces cf. hyalinus JEL632]
MAPLGESIPAHNTHAVSVSLPTWSDNVKYEEGDPLTIAALKCGYPRFVYHPLVVKVFEHFEKAFGRQGEACRVFPSSRSVKECRAFMKKMILKANSGYDSSLATSIRIVEFAVRPIFQESSPSAIDPAALIQNTAFVYALMFPVAAAPVAKMFWQHAGEGISSRFAEYCLRVLGSNKQSVEYFSDRPGSGEIRGVMAASDRFQTPGYKHQDQSGHMEGTSGSAESNASHLFVEERFGRNLDFSLAAESKHILKKRIAGVLADETDGKKSAQTSDQPRGSEVNESHVYLFPTGMSAIYNAYRAAQALLPNRKTVQFGFPYTDTLKIQEKFNDAGCIFLGHGTNAELDDLEKLLESGERVSALFCEFPSNPLLKSADLKRIRSLADRFDFLLIVDETIGNFYNVGVLSWADIVVSSLTKIFSGDSNVMGGSAVLNPTSPNFERVKRAFEEIYEDTMWDEDALFLERNSRNFVARLTRINQSAEKLATFLHNHPKVEKLHYPLFSDHDIYAAHMREGGGYGGLLSVILPDSVSAARFYDRLDVAKGPSLGTNFTLASPYTILAHFTELEWAEKFGVPARLVRVSVGLEDVDELIAKFDAALNEA